MKLKDEMKHIFNKKEDTIFVLFFHSPSCPPCSIAIKTFSRISVIDKLNNIPLSFHAVYAPSNPDLIDMFKIRSVPTTVFFRPNRNLTITKGGILSISEYEENIDLLFK